MLLLVLMKLSRDEKAATATFQQETGAQELTDHNDAKNSTEQMSSTHFTE